MLKRIVVLMLAAYVFLPMQLAYASDKNLNKAATQSLAKQNQAQQVLGQQAPVQGGYSRHVVQLMPYLWATGLKGNVSPFKRGPTMDIEKTFSDVMGDLNLGGFLNVWGRYDNFVFSGDFMYVDTTDSHTAGPVPQLPIHLPFPPGSVLKASVDTEQIMIALQGGYRVHDTEQFTLDVLAGARFWHIENDVTVRVGGISRSYGERFNWVDPTVGVRGHVPLNDKISFDGAADIGGFGVGSEFTWAAMATFNYRVTDSVAIAAGYKVLDVDYSKSGHVYDVRLNGPVLGLTWRF